MSEVELSWQWSPFARRLITVAAAALVCAFALARPELIVLAAAPLAWLALASAGPEPTTARVRFLVPQRCFEREVIDVSVFVGVAADVEMITAHLLCGPGWQLAGPLRPQARRGRRTALSARVSAPRWGRHALGAVRVELWQRRRLRHAIGIASAPAEVAVFPRPVPMRRLPVSAARFDRIGDHPAAVAGSGIEFHTVRRYAAGDRRRRINWSATTRRGVLHVNDTRAERSVDVVVAVDVLVDAGQPGFSSRDLALRAATGVTQVVLRSHDRVGLIAVGGRLNWLTPAPGARQFYRVAQAILDVVDWESYLDPDVATIPYPALPAGAHILYFSPLLDDRGIVAACTLRSRGHPVTVIDICTSEPAARRGSAELALHLWRLERAATRLRLAALGVPVVAWDGSGSLETTIAPLLRASERAPR